MIEGSNPVIKRIGQTLRTQLAHKQENIEEPKSFQFDSPPPVPILPNISEGTTPTVLDFHPEELARQFSLMKFEMFVAIKPLEILNFNKPSSWRMELEEEEEPGTENSTNAPRLVNFIYHFTDVRDWVATEIVKRTDKHARAQIMTHFISTAEVKFIFFNNL